MKPVRTVARGELRGYFDHPTGYILIVAFLGLGIFLAFRSLYSQGAATLRPFFDLLPWFFAVFVPAITMRSLAEERRGHTLEWLMAQPLRESDVVAGKFLGDWLFVLVMLAGTLPMALGILLFSQADPGIMLAQYAGAALLAAEMVGVGLWASSVTGNQITAFILGVTVSLLLVLIGTPVVQIGLPSFLAAAVARLSVLGHFDNVARGVIDLRDVLYFASTAAFFLLLAWAVITGQRLARTRGGFRRLRLGATAAGVAVLVLNLLGGHVRGRLDLTRNHLYTLSNGTRQILRGVNDIVTIKLFVSSQLPPEIQLSLRDVRDLLADMRQASDGHLIVQEENPDKNDKVAGEARSLGIGPIEFNVMRNEEFQVKRGWFGLAILYADKHTAIPVVDRTDDLEFRLASAVSSITATQRPHLAFVTGFGARGAYAYPALQKALSDHFQITSVSLEGKDPPQLSPDSIKVLALIAPTQPLDSTAVQRISSFVDQGGAALLLLEHAQISPQTPVSNPVRTGLETFLQQHGVRLDNGLAYDLRSHANVSMGQQGIFNIVRGYPLWPVAMPAGKHATTRDLQNLSFAWASPLVITDTADVKPLWETTDAGGEMPAGSPIAPDALQGLNASSRKVEVLAAAIDPNHSQSKDAKGPTTAAAGGRMIVVGDADFLRDDLVNANPQNLVFAANAADWLSQDEALIRIRSKQRTPPALVFGSSGEKSGLKWGSLVGIPLLFAASGLLRIGGRRRRAQHRWADREESA